MLRLLRPRGPWTAALLVLAPACAEPSAPSWRALTDFPELERERTSQGQLANGEPVRVVVNGSETWLAKDLARADWRPLETPGQWIAVPGLYGVGRPPTSDDAYQLQVGDASFELELSAKRFGEAPGRFLVRQGEVLLSIPAGEPAPERATLRIPASHAVDDGPGQHRVQGRRFSGNGFSVWPGESRTLEVTFRPHQALRFATVAEQAHRSLDEGPGYTFRIFLDDELLFEHVESGVNRAHWHTVDLPPEGRAGARMRLEMEGSFAFGAFLDPVFGPVFLGTYGRRPWKENRPDMVVFLADTYRADNLSVYGSDLSLTPELDRLAREGRVYERAWSVSTHTLPAQSSMLTGVYPPQNGQLGYEGTLADEAVTITELLAARGYRTAAVTDGLMVSQVRGMDQGFGYFDEQIRDFDWTLERLREVLAADDGRPLFLFVQSYAAHSPYDPSEVARRELGETLDLSNDFHELTGRLKREAGTEDRLDLSDLGTREASAGLDHLYRAGAADLDRGFGELRSELERRGLFPQGVLIVTSDHGEAFSEHGEIFHGGRVFEEQLRIPLLVAGDRIEPGRVSHGASLVDLAPTLADLAGLQARAVWGGTSWLRLEEERPIIAFQARLREDSTLAVVQGQRKIVLRADRGALDRRELVGAYDLEHDPGERHNLMESERWPRELLEALAPRLEPLFEPLVQSRRAVLDTDALETLHDAGYY